MNTYPSYKDSGVEWIGEIPSGWDVKRLDHFFTQRKDKVDDTMYPPLSVTMKGIKNQLEEVAKSDDNSNRKLVLKNDFVINSRSDRRGSSGISFRDGSVSLINTVLEPKNINTNYVEYLLKSHYFIEEYFRFGKGIHFDLWSTNYSLMKNIKIPVLSEEQQQQISDYLDHKTSKIDTLLEKTQQKIEFLKEQRISLINTTVTKGLDPNVEMKDSGVEWIGEIPSGWSVRKLKYISNLKTDKGDTSEGDIKISPENVESYTGVCFNLHSEQEGKGTIFKPGDILFNKLRLYLVKIISPDYEGYSMGEMIVIRMNKNISNRFYFYTFFNQGFINLLESQSTGVKLPRVSPDVIMSSKLPLPSLQEQQQIVDYLDKETSKIDKLVDIESKRIILLKEYRQSLISDVVTGKVDVRDEVLV